MTEQPKTRPGGTSASKVTTGIVKEYANESNPYLADDLRVHGYSIKDLSKVCSFTDLMFLHMRGELPTPKDRKLLDEVLVAIGAPGPRHPAVRAAMYASVSKTSRQNVLPIGLAVLSGEHLGAKECADAMTFIRSSVTEDPGKLAFTLMSDQGPWYDDTSPVPGFGSRFGGADPLPALFLKKAALRKKARRHAKWAHTFSLALQQYGVKATGYAAAMFLDLGLSEPQGAGVFQVAASPHIIALAADTGKRGPSAMPFLSDDHYHIKGGDE